MATEPLQIIIAGASGRMGSQLVNLVLNDDSLALAGVSETSANMDKISVLPCFYSSNMLEVATKFPKAVIIDFTSPESTLSNLAVAAQTSNAMVIGTTGFNDSQIAELENFAAKIPLFWSVNMSVGINVLLEVLPLLARSLGEDYDMEIMEMHHKFKKDAPGGTALKLADCLAKSRGWDHDYARVSGRDGIIGERKHKEIGVQALRGGDVVGIHSAWFLGPGETIQVTHQAESRENFARGALRAARWLALQKPGRVYSMKDVLGLQAD